MDENLLKSIAQQLRRPQGELAIEVGKKMNQGNRLINLYTIDTLNLQIGDNVLEIGMGNGFFVKDILAKGNSIKYVGCDFSEAMINEASKLNKDFIKKGLVEIHLTNADNLPFENDIFDKVFTVNTIYFWDQPQNVLSEIHRVLKPSGKLTIALRPKADMVNYPMTRFGFNMFSKNDLEKLLAENKFQVSDFFIKEEPDQEILELKMKIKSLIISAEKLKSSR